MTKSPKDIIDRLNARAALADAIGYREAACEIRAAVREIQRLRIEVSTLTSTQDGLSGDLLSGAEEIAKFLFGDESARRKVYHLSGLAEEQGRLPVFRIGAILCSRRSTILRWIEEQERRS